MGRIVRYGKQVEKPLGLRARWFPALVGPTTAVYNDAIAVGILGGTVDNALASVTEVFALGLSAGTADLVFALITAATPLGIQASTSESVVAIITALTSIGVGAATADSVAATFAAIASLGLAGGTSDIPVASFRPTLPLGLQAGTLASAVAAISSAIAAGITQGVHAAQFTGVLYQDSIGLGAAAASATGAAVGASVAAAMTAQQGVSFSPHTLADAIALLAADVGQHSSSALTAAANAGFGIGAAIAAQGGLRFLDSIALSVFSSALADSITTAVITTIYGRGLIDLRVTRDTFIHYIADNVSLPVHAVRRDPNDRSADSLAMNAVNVEFFDFRLAYGAALSSLRVSIDIINDDENTAVDWLTEVGRLLTATFFAQMSDYTDPSSPIPQHSNLIWNPQDVAFKKINNESYSHFHCSLSLQFLAI